MNRTRLVIESTHLDKTDAGVITTRCTGSRGPRGFWQHGFRRGPVNVDVIQLNQIHAMATPKRTKGRRRITVDQCVYTWDASKWESSGFVTIRHADGHPASIKVSPLCILLPKQIANCVRFALQCGWKSDSNQTIWLGYTEDGSTGGFDDVFKIESDAKPVWNRLSQRWTLAKKP